MQNSNNNLRVFLAILGLFFLQLTRAQSVNDPRLAGIETKINKILADHHAAGVAVAVVEKTRLCMQAVLDIGISRRNCR
jgi:hypothetical protein